MVRLSAALLDQLRMYAPVLVFAAFLAVESIILLEDPRTNTEVSWNDWGKESRSGSEVGRDPGATLGRLDNQISFAAFWKWRTKLGAPEHDRSRDGEWS